MVGMEVENREILHTRNGLLWALRPLTCFFFFLQNLSRLDYRTVILFGTNPQASVEDMPLNGAVRRANTHLTKRPSLV